MPSSPHMSSTSSFSSPSSNKPPFAMLSPPPYSLDKANPARSLKPNSDPSNSPPPHTTTSRSWSCQAHHFPSLPFLTAYPFATASDWLQGPPSTLFTQLPTPTFSILHTSPFSMQQASSQQPWPAHLSGVGPTSAAGRKLVWCPVGCMH
jgi:hypothetical protein